MNLKSQRRLASKILKCGLSRVKIIPSKEVEEALTRKDIKLLIRKGMIYKEQKKGTSNFRSKKIREQKKKGRRKGKGSRKGSVNARKDSKEKWIEMVRALRKLLKEMKDAGQISKKDYRDLYAKVKGGFFRSKKHLLTYMKDREMIKKSKKEAKEILKKKVSKA